jgi:hypothetical protein
MASWFRYVESDGASEVEATAPVWAPTVTDDGIRSLDFFLVHNVGSQLSRRRFDYLTRTRVTVSSWAQPVS